MGDGGTRPKGWFSRRHETDSEHREAVALYREERATARARLARSRRAREVRVATTERSQSEKDGESDAAHAG